MFILFIAFISIRFILPFYLLYKKMVVEHYLTPNRTHSY